MVLIAAVALDARQAPALRIVVLEGEGAVNIIQQKTAVRPLVEVRDRNDLPVAGASVTFSIGGGQGASFAGGAQTVTVTTNAAGQAAAPGLNAVNSGTFRIQVQAAYQGLLATAAISQTNFATAAAALQAGAGAGTGGTATSAAAGGAAGGGGGVSATTIGIIGAAVGGGALVATQTVLKKESDESRSDADAFDGYNGSLSGSFILTSVFTPSIGPPTNCASTRTVTGSMTIELRQSGSGVATMQVSHTEVALTGNCIPSSTPTSFSLQRENTPVTGGPSAIAFSGTAPVGVVTHHVRFTGSLSGNTITGALALDVVPTAGANPAFNGSTTLQVVLTGPRP